jgi:hypothetical protein
VDVDFFLIEPASKWSAENREDRGEDQGGGSWLQLLRKIDAPEDAQLIDSTPVIADYRFELTKLLLSTPSPAV